MIEESETYRRFTPQPHAHVWQFAQGSPYYWFGTQSGGCGIGEGRHRNNLAYLTERPFGEIDEFLAKKLSSGQLATNRLYAALVSPKVWSKATNDMSASQELAQRLYEEFFDQLSDVRPASDASRASLNIDR